mmetsp:Transcript_78308/g.138297  ORF Transcript_78308/g.138297 Transcript_78308/m.138297 type:complete len:275 (-) Transcript_78308:1033-1857(-)
MHSARKSASEALMSASVGASPTRAESRRSFSTRISCCDRDRRFCWQSMTPMLTRHAMRVTCCTRFCRCTMLATSKEKVSGTVKAFAACLDCSNSRRPVRTTTAACPCARSRACSCAGSCFAMTPVSHSCVLANDHCSRVMARATYSFCNGTAWGLSWSMAIFLRNPSTSSWRFLNLSMTNLKASTTNPGWKSPSRASHIFCVASFVALLCTGASSSSTLPMTKQTKFLSSSGERVFCSTSQSSVFCSSFLKWLSLGRQLLRISVASLIRTPRRM